MVSYSCSMTHQRSILCVYYFKAIAQFHSFVVMLLGDDENKYLCEQQGCCYTKVIIILALSVYCRIAFLILYCIEYKAFLLFPTSVRPHSNW